MCHHRALLARRALAPRVLVRRAGLLALASLPLLGCKPASQRVLRAEGRPTASVVPAPPSASARTESVAPSEVTPQAEQAFERARSLVQEGKYRDAIETCDAALDKDHLDARLLGEKAYIRAHYLNERGDEVLEDFWFAASGSGTEHAKAEIWLHRARFEKLRAHTEGWRASLARSLSIEPNATLAAELGARSRCLAEIRVSTSGLAHVVTGWLGVCREVGKSKPGDSVDEATARPRACLSHPGYAGLDASHGCTDDPPWVSTHDYAMYHFTEDFIVPAGGNRFFVMTGRVGEWPAHCDPSVDTRREVIGGLVQVTTELVEHTRPPRSDSEGECWDSLAQVQYEYFSLTSGRSLLSLTMLKDDPIQVNLDAAARRVTLTGGGCDGSVALDGRAWLRPAP